MAPVQNICTHPEYAHSYRTFGKLTDNSAQACSTCKLKNANDSKIIIGCGYNIWERASPLLPAASLNPSSSFLMKSEPLQHILVDQNGSNHNIQQPAVVCSGRSRTSRHIRKPIHCKSD